MTGRSHNAILVTDGNHRAALAVVRALGRAGLSVVAGECRGGSLAGSSRYCAETIRYPSPWEAPREFEDFLRRELSTGKYEMLLPITDVTMQSAARIRDTLSSRCCFPFPAAETLELVQDKRHMLLAARRVGLAVPETLMLSEGVEDAAQRVTYPAVIKPRFSCFFREGLWTRGAVRYALGPQDLITQYAQMHAQIPQPLIQERIVGEGRGVFLLIWEGELKAAFCHRRLREKPPWGGVSVYSESVPLDEELVQKSYEMLRAVGWQGVAMVEFKVDRRDGRPKLMEVNGRFWGSLQLPVDAGMNFPLLLYRAAAGEKIIPQFDYKIAVKHRWFLGDLDHLLIRLTHPIGPNGSSGGEESRLRACLNFLKFFEPSLHYEVLRFDDPWPGIVELGSYAGQTLRSLRRRSV